MDYREKQYENEIDYICTTCFGSIKFILAAEYKLLLLGAVARSEACPLDMQLVPSSIPTSSTFFRGEMVMKKISTAVLPLALIQEEQLSVTGKRMCIKYW